MKVSCIIPAYNESLTLPQVLESARHDQIDETIVVDDGSNDNTYKIAKMFNVKVIRNKTNLGKAKSMILGAAAAKNKILLFLDADLEDLKPNHIARLVDPILEREADVTISDRSDLLLFRVLGFDFISGERCIQKNTFLQFASSIDTRYGIEVLMNKYILDNNLRFKIADLREVKHLHKVKKRGLLKGIKDDVGMWTDIVKIMPFHKLTFQMLQMHKRRIPY